MKRHVTDEEIFNALRTFYAREGCSPSSRVWRAQKQRPGRTTIMSRFGSWKEALRAAGLPPDYYIHPMRKDDETLTVIARLKAGEALTDLAREYGIGVPTLSSRVTRYCKRSGIQRPQLARGLGSFEDREAAQLADESRRLA